MSEEVSEDIENNSGEEDSSNNSRREPLKAKDNYKIFFIEVFNNLKDKQNAVRDKSYESNMKDSIRDELNKKLVEEGISPTGKIYKKNIVYDSTIIVDENSFKKSYSFDVDNRIKFIEQQIKMDDYDVTNYTFDIKISDLLNIYNDLGDTFFNNNIRIGGISDNIEVAESIQETYIVNPEQFFYFNNGISLLVDESVNLDLSYFNEFSITGITDSKSISVINGAQTLTVLGEANFNSYIDILRKKYFNKPEEKSISETEVVKYAQQKSKENARVLLRVFKINKINKEDSDIKIDRKEFVENITLSLNRQKPIKQADLAYTTYFVDNISDFYRENQSEDEMKKFVFDFIRSGEETSMHQHRYTLGGFAKVVSAYLEGRPNSSRTRSYNTLLKVDEDEFKEKGIFKEYDEDNPKEWFLKHYKPVNFAMGLKEMLDTETELKNSLQEFIDNNTDEIDFNEEFTRAVYEDNLKTLDKYGHLLIISLIINMRNNDLVEQPFALNDDNKDFSNWEFSKIEKVHRIPDDTEELIYSISNLRDDLKSIIKAFSKYLVEEEKNEIIESNNFKNDEIALKIFEKIE